MSIADAGRLAGSLRWAVVPYAPAPPFRLFAGNTHAPIVAPDADTVLRAARGGGDAELSYIVSGKARPVLILSDAPARHHLEVTALRLLRLSKLSDDEQQRVRADGDELLFHLAPDRFGLPDESAAMVSALVRLHVAAIGSGPPLGYLDASELRVLGERIIRFYGFDTRLLVERQIRELAARRRAQVDQP